MVENSSILREWDVLDDYYHHGDPTPAVRRIGERMLDHCLSMPVGDRSGTIVVHDGDCSSPWNYENPPPRPPSSIHCEEIPPEEVTDEMTAAAVRPTHIEES
jgi:hypothetical protein